VCRVHLFRPTARKARLTLSKLGQFILSRQHPTPPTASRRSATDTITDASPNVWLLIGDKLGDNAQARMLADALGWPYQVRQVFPQPEWVLGKPRFVPGLHHLDPERSASLEPPWPDIVITVGRRLL